MGKLYAALYYHDRVVDVRNVPENLSEAEVVAKYAEINQINKQYMKDCSQFRIVEVADSTIQEMMDFVIHKNNHLNNAVFNMKNSLDEIYSFDSGFYSHLLNPNTKD